MTRPPRTANVLEYRLPVYPVCRGRAPDYTHSGRYGECRISVSKEADIRIGAISERHRCLLDAVMTYATWCGIDPVRRLVVFFDIANIRRALGTPSLRWRDVRQSLIELIGVHVQIRRPNEEWPAIYPLVAGVDYAATNHSAPRRAGQFTGRGQGDEDDELRRDGSVRLIRLTFSEGYTAALAAGVGVRLSKTTLTTLLNMRHAVSRTVARWALTHSNVQHHPLADLLSTLDLVKPGGDGVVRIRGRSASRQARDYVAQLMRDRVLLAHLGVEITDGAGGYVLHYRRRDGAVFVDAVDAVGTVEAETTGVEAETTGVEAETTGP
ncbi:MAG: hypothetical protein KJ558_07100 [Gammaproteobacteria bacterium]|nr:hypothetical protein [Gammaproteobacteria bacterium]MBU1654583.1 hypothetical protein [Gammaproteobacteria bacterium]MBU1961975.1 hypothetical protein [Gammaproteobacteria bacterium]